MLSNQIIQSSIDELRCITKIDLCVMDLQGTVAASTIDDVEIPIDLVREFAESAADSQVISGYHFFKVLEDEEVVYLVLTRGNEDAHMVGKIAVTQLRQLMTAYKEKLSAKSHIG